MQPLAHPATVRPSSAAGRDGPHRVYALILLMLVYTCHSIDRGIVSVVLEPVKREFHVSDKVMGFVPLAYSLAFIVAVLPLGSLIDRVHRVRLLALLLAIWSLMTATAGLVASIALLIVARMGVGAAEAGGQPISLSLLSDIFHQRRRASALGVFYLATGFGSIFAFLGGALITADHGWRATFLMGGVPGLILVPVLLLTLREPRRGAMDAAPVADSKLVRQSMAAALRFAVGSPAIRMILAGTLLSSFVLGSFIQWVPAFLMREHGFTIRVAGLSAAFAGGLMPACGAIVCGFVADRLGRDRPERVGLTCAFSLVAMALAGIAFTLVSNAMVTIACLVLFGFFGGGWMAPSLALLIGLTPTTQRGAVMAFGQIFTALGSGVGPFIVGWLSDAFHSLGPALACGAAVGFGAMLLYVGGVARAGRLLESRG